MLQSEVMLPIFKTKQNNQKQWPLVVEFSIMMNKVYSWSAKKSVSEGLSNFDSL